MEDMWKPNKLWIIFAFLHTLLPFSESTEEDQTKDETDSHQVAEGPDDDSLSKLKVPRKLPSIVEIKKALPAHCFEPILQLSVYYMVKDFVLVVLLAVLCEWTWGAFPPLVQIVITPLFWLVQGTLFTAIFVVGHDAGHGSFSKSDWINDVCGNLCHSFLFCPYYMWKLSHRKHHKNTGNMDKDEVYYPVRKRDNNRTYLLPGFGLFVGWFTYLVKGYRPRQVAHYNPWDPMFTSHVKDCLLSFVSLVLWCACLWAFKDSFGWGSMLYHHTVPTAVFGAYIVIITFLHHTDDDIPWYSDHLWNYVRGQLSSVDRHYGWCHNLLHNIPTHQVHHLFPVVPHYHLEEATAAFRKAFPNLVNIRSEPILPAFYRMFRKYASQSIIADDAAIHVYK